ncbi:MAG: invasin domain 3-containing protein [Gemmatimonadales bacterium]
MGAPLSLVLAGLYSCGGDELSLPNEGQPARISVLRGNGQSGTIGEPLGDSLVVRVLDRFGQPVGGVQVTWTAVVGGSVNPATSTTSSKGDAATERVLGTELGTYVTTAAVAGAEGAPEPAVFITTGVAAQLALTVAPAATAVSGVPLDPQPVLQLRDTAGNDVARGGVVVTAQLAAGDASLDGDTTATSDETGRVAFADLTIRGAPGVQTLAFVAEGFAPATAIVGLGVGSPASIAGTAGDGQSAVVASAVATAPAVVVRDADGNALAGIPVMFKVTGGGGSLSGANPVTGNDGIAAVSKWTLGPKAGANTVSATISGLDLSGSPVVFGATATPGPLDPDKTTVDAAPATITASGGSSQSTITVSARDGYDNPIPGLAVTLSASGTGNTLSQPAGPTRSDGSITGLLSAASPGDRVVSAVVAGTAVSQTATVTVTSGAPSPVRSTASVPAGKAGEATLVEIRLKDAQGNDVPGQAGAIAVSVAGANPKSAVAASDDGGGRYTATYTPTKAGSDKVQVKVSGTGLPGSPYASTVMPGATDARMSQAVVPACVESSQLPAKVTVTAYDAFGNRIAHGGDGFEIRVNQGVILKPNDNGNGTYTAALALAVGVFRVDITLAGKAVDESPYQIVVPFPFSGC